MIDAVDILYLAWNRHVFTVETLGALRANTDWARVRRLWLYDDGSTDGTLQLLERFAAKMEIATQVVKTNYRSPVASMNDFLTQREPSPWFVKLDNDAMMPPGWLEESLRVVDDDPHVDLLGFEAIYPPGVVSRGRPRTALRCGHIGGVGLMRTAAFKDLPVAAGRLGFSDWQIKHDVVKAWMNPGMQVFLLDRLHFEPWTSVSKDYERQGWQRPWKRYTDAEKTLWEWWRK